jgi:hypothetical protein
MILQWLTLFSVLCIVYAVFISQAIYSFSRPSSEPVKADCDQPRPSFNIARFCLIFLFSALSLVFFMSLSNK